MVVIDHDYALPFFAIGSYLGQATIRYFLRKAISYNRRFPVMSGCPHFPSQQISSKMELNEPRPCEITW